MSVSYTHLFIPQRYGKSSQRNPLSRLQGDDIVFFSGCPSLHHSQKVMALFRLLLGHDALVHGVIFVHQAGVRTVSYTHLPTPNTKNVFKKPFTIRGF